MKIYVYPNSPTELAALVVEPEPAVIAAHSYGDGTEQGEAVLALRDLIQNTVPGGPHAILWVPDPQVHPVVRPALARIMYEQLGEPEESDEGEAKCTTCVHARVCQAAAAVDAIGATINACPEHVPTPTEGEPNP